MCVYAVSNLLFEIENVPLRWVVKLCRKGLVDNVFLFVKMQTINQVTKTERFVFI